MDFENIRRIEKNRLLLDMQQKDAEDIDFDIFLENISKENLWREFSGSKYVISDIFLYNFNRLSDSSILEKVDKVISGDNHYIAQELITCLEGLVHKINDKNQSDWYERMIINKPSDKLNERDAVLVKQIKLRNESLPLIKDQLIKLTNNEDLKYITKLRLLNFLESYEEPRRNEIPNWLPEKISKDDCMVVLGEEAILLDNAQEPALVNFINEKKEEDSNRVARTAQTIGNSFADQLSTRYRQNLIGGNKPTNFQEIKNKFPDSILLKDYIENQAVLLDNNINQEDYLRDFLFLSSPLTRNLLKKELNVNLEEVSVKTRFFLLNFLKSKNSTGAELIKSFCSKFREEGLNGFLSLEMGAEIGDEILNIGNNLDYLVAKKIFIKISELTALIEKNDDELREVFGVSDANDCRELRLNLLAKTVKIIKDFSDSVSEAKTSNDKIDNLILDLERTKGELIILTTILKRTKAEGRDIKFNLIKDIHLEINRPGEEISEDDKEQIIRIAQINWQEQNPAIADEVIRGLKESLRDTKSQRCYTLKYKNEVIGFVRFEPTKNNNLYVGSLNVIKDLRGLNIGNSLMDESIVREAENNVLEATASPRIPAACNYIDKLGFVATGIISSYHQTGEPLFTIELDKTKNLEFVYKKDSIKLEQIKLQAQDYNNIDQLLGQETIVLKFDVDREFNQYQQVLDKLLIKMDDVDKPIDSQSGKDKYIITRYFPEQEKTEGANIRYLVFEKIDFVSKIGSQSRPQAFKNKLV